MLKIKVLGSGCANCHKVEELARRAVAQLGIVTPFCSCSAVPLFVGFVESGIPLGVTFSFLIAAPVINEVAVVLLFGMFGWKVATLYVISGLIMAIAAGMVIGRLNLERYVEDFVWQIEFSAAQDDSGRATWEQRFRRGRDAVREIVGKVWLFVVVGIANLLFESEFLPDV